MDDRLFYPLMAALAAGLIALATVWPQGQGARSPGPFGHTPEQQRPEVRAAMERERMRAALASAESEDSARRAEEAAAAARAKAGQ